MGNVEIPPLSEVAQTGQATPKIRLVLEQLPDDHDAFTAKQMEVMLAGQFSYEQVRQSLIYLESKDEIVELGKVRGMNTYKKVIVQ